MDSTDQTYEQNSFEEFEAARLFCAQCRQAVPVRKRLVIVLPDGDEYDYRCAYCGTSVGIKVVSRKQNLQSVPGF